MLLNYIVYGTAQSAVVEFKIFRSAGSITKDIFSASSISTNDTSIDNNPGRFADLVIFRMTIL